MISQFEAFALIWVLITALLSLVTLTDDRLELSTTQLVSFLARNIAAGFMTVVAPSVIVLGMKAITPFTTVRGRTVPGFFGEVAAVVVAAVGLYMMYTTPHGNPAEEEGPTLSDAGHRAAMRTVGGGMAATALVAGFL